MKTGLLIAMAAAATALPASYIEQNEGLLWASFKQTYGKSYSGSDERVRRAVFKRNMLKGSELEASSKTGAQFGMSPFADLTEEEFKVYHSLSFPEKAGPPAHLTEEEKKAAATGSVDWRAKGAVTHVKNQGQCGSCWSFSSTGGIEGQYFLAGHALTPVSEQELVSCDHVDGGCDGGLMDNAFKWLVDNHSGEIVTEEAYPYTSGGGVSGTCQITSDMKIGAKISSHADLPHTEEAMASWIQTNGPISIAVDATSFQTYTGGILDNCISNHLDHGVLAVGVTPTYWIIKNSWGASWGESGYLRVARGTNQCLLANNPCHPIVGAVPLSPPATSFTQKTCPTATCSSGCTSRAFPLGQCVPMAGGGSATIASCTSNGLVIKQFASADCTGASTSLTQPVDQCVADVSGTYLENSCSAEGSFPLGTSFHKA